jgi:hypothetical protein
MKLNLDLERSSVWGTAPEAFDSKYEKSPENLSRLLTWFNNLSEFYFLHRTTKTSPSVRDPELLGAAFCDLEFAWDAFFGGKDSKEKDAQIRDRISNLYTYSTRWHFFERDGKIYYSLGKPR